ncbi:hypothetical protein BC835DRAFT_1346080 [Cytidiella melzeri]|nr:hypothetical protein BC835DRAFT_1346080 [Cytidiella melzeri]
MSHSDVPPPSANAIWWTNGALFVSMHLAAAAGVYYHPAYKTSRPTLCLAFFLWQAACFGITIGYHRLHSHKAFKTGTAPRFVLALLGASAFQGSIRRYTDDPVHDPYCATRGLMWSHMGWIFFKPTYERMPLIERDDLDRDPVVRWQHRNYIPLAIATAFVLPTMIGWMWGDALGAFIWCGLVVRIAVWHCTFLINSLAHWDGLQPYSDENTSRTNLILAMLTCGEGNHNFHAFPHDFRSGPALLDWDPSKWIILLLYYSGLASGLRRARKEDQEDALAHMAHHHGSHLVVVADTKDIAKDEQPLSSLTLADLCRLVEVDSKKFLLLIGDNVVDAADYLGEHPGGGTILSRYAVRVPAGETALSRATALERRKEATWAFEGGMNKHSRMAKTRLRELTIGKLVL